MKRAALHNLGCKVNAGETEAMAELLKADGYEIVPFEEEADVYVINTCTVTQVADRKSRQMLRRAKRLNPHAVVVAAGCYVESEQHLSQMADAVDIFIGNREKGTLISKIDTFLQEGSVIYPGSVSDKTGYEPLKVTSSQGKVRAFLKIQDGCDRFCSYCIIPYVRGRICSMDPADVIAQVRDLSAQGAKEIVLDGIHLTSYGRDNGKDFIELIGEIAQVEGIERVRLGSLEPGFITEETAAELAKIKKLCPHFHLSLQSGSTSVLKRMNRRYTAEEFADKCRILREAFDDPAITTDIIVGFPGETEEEFAETRAFLEQIQLYEIHVFPYSVREGTKAASMPDQVPKAVKTLRSKELLALTQMQKRSFEQRRIGRTLEVLVEEVKEIDGRNIGVGHTREYIYVQADAQTGELKSGRLDQDLHLV